MGGFVYDIGYGTCEESQYWQYMHEEKFTSDEIQKIVEDCLFEVIEYVSGLKTEPRDLMNRLHFLESGPSFQGLMGTPKFHERLKKRGFKAIEFEAKCNLFGWASAIKPGDWDCHADSTDGKFQENLLRRMKKAGIYVKVTKVKCKEYTDEVYSLARKERKKKQ
jgi:hypothetical protein